MPRLPVSERSRSRCIFSASDSAAPVPTFFESTSIRHARVVVSIAHRSNRSRSSARLRSKVTYLPSGDSFRFCGWLPFRSGLANTRSSVRSPGFAGSPAIPAVPIASNAAPINHFTIVPRIHAGRMRADRIGRYRRGADRGKWCNWARA